MRDDMMKQCVLYSRWLVDRGLRYRSYRSWFKRLFMVRITLFEGTITQAVILLHRVVRLRCRDGCFVDYIIGQTLFFHRTGLLSNTITCSFLLLVGSRISVVWTDNWFGFRHTTVTHFHGVFVENLVELCIFCENVSEWCRESFFPMFVETFLSKDELCHCFLFWWLSFGGVGL